MQSTRAGEPAAGIPRSRLHMASIHHGDGCQERHSRVTARLIVPPRADQPFPLAPSLRLVKPVITKFTVDSGFGLRSCDAADVHRSGRGSERRCTQDRSAGSGDRGDLVIHESATACLSQMVADALGGL